MIDLAIRLSLLSSIGGLLMFGFRRRSASVRHALVVALLVANGLLPIFNAVLPPVGVPVPSVAPSAPTTVTFAQSSVPGDASAAVRPSENVPTRPAKPFPWSVLWAFGTVLVLARTVALWVLLRRRLRSAVPVDGLAFPVAAVQSDAFSTPFVAWIGRPLLVLPAGWRGWSGERLDMVLRHEAAHLTRGDGWSLGIARLACAVAWPNPLAWWLAWTESRLAEQAADDWAVGKGEGVPAWAYAQELLAIAREPKGAGSWPALDMARKAEVSHRVEMILNPRVPRQFVHPTVRRVAVVTSALLSVPVATWGLQPQGHEIGNAPDVSVAVTAIANPIAFRLRCRIVRVDSATAPATRGTPNEPQIGQADATRVVNSPDLYTGNGTPAALKVTVNGVVHTVELRAVTGDDFMCDLNASESVPYKGTRMGYNSFDYRTAANDWVIYPLSSMDGQLREKYAGYQMLIQVTPYKGEGPPPEPKSLSMPQAKPASKPVRRSGPPPAQVLLRCKIVRTGDPGPGQVSTSDEEPRFTDGDRVRVVSAPTVRDVVGESAEINVTAENKAMGAKFIPSALENGEYALRVEAFVRDGTPYRNTYKTTVRMKSSQWIRFRLLDENKRFHGYQMIVQLVPVREGE